MSPRYVTESLTASLAEASGMPIPPDQLSAATELLDALYGLEAQLTDLDLDGVEPEWRWDARWEIAEGDEA